jgi:hypothetical protein
MVLLHVVRLGTPHISSDYQYKMHKPIFPKLLALLSEICKIYYAFFLISFIISVKGYTSQAPHLQGGREVAESIPVLLTGWPQQSCQAEREDCMPT